MATAVMGIQAQKNMENKIVKQEIKLTEKWDKVFPQSVQVDHKKVTVMS